MPGHFTEHSKETGTWISLVFFRWPETGTNLSTSFCLFRELPRCWNVPVEPQVKGRRHWLTQSHEGNLAGGTARPALITLHTQRSQCDLQQLFLSSRNSCRLWGKFMLRSVSRMGWAHVHHREIQI